MIDFFLEREWDTPMMAEQFLQMASRSEGCFDLHRVEWQQSMLASGGVKLVCWFRSMDMESVRIVLRSEDSDISDLWPGEATRVTLWSGSVHDAPGVDESDIHSANVIVERSFDEPVTLEEIQVIEDAGASCLEMRGVRFMRTFFSRDRKRMLCLYQAPDAESVRQAQHEAGMPVEGVWAFKSIFPQSENTTGA